MRLQAKAEEMLEGREGAVVVLDTRTGQLLALASFPTFDPNKFINRFTPEEWIDLINNPSFPLENRAFRGLYAPGSIFKLVMALAALETDLFLPVGKADGDRDHRRVCPDVGPGEAHGHRPEGRIRGSGAESGVEETG
jgi:cell division protein FtsI/penicillin-binding protein 2